MSELLTPSEWCTRTGIKVMDPDGWRADGKSWDDPVSEDEFRQRLWTSTISAPKGAWDALMARGAE